jgi:hypothetical protein
MLHTFQSLPLQMRRQQQQQQHLPFLLEFEIAACLPRSIASM